jgi:hypothetical protein
LFFALLFVTTFPEAREEPSHPQQLFVVVQNGRYGYIDAAGKLAIAPQFDDAENFSEGLAAVMVGGRWGYIDTTGQTIVPFRFDSATEFSEALAGVELEKKWGYIDRRGEFVIAPQFQYRLWPFRQGLARTETGSPTVRFDQQGNPRPGHPWGFIDKSGKFVIPPGYEWVFDFSEGRAAVQVGKKWGFIDTTGRYVAVPQFRQAWDYSHGLAPVSLGGKWGYINDSGRFVIPPQFDDAFPFSEGAALVQVGNKVSYINEAGRPVIPIQFDDGLDFSAGLAAVKLDGKWGYIDHAGRLVIPPRYTETESFAAGLAQVKIGAKAEYIDHTGRTVWTREPEVLRSAQEIDDEKNLARLNRLSFESRKIKERKQNVYKIDVTYPQLESSVTGSSSFNRWMKELVLNEVAQFRKNAIKDARAEQTSTGHREYELHITFDPIFSSEDIVSLMLIKYADEGSAHGEEDPIPINFSLKNANPISINQIFIPNSKYLQTFSAYCFARLRELGVGYPVQWRTEGTAPKAENYRKWNIARDGILISFDDYQVGPHSMGEPRILVPYTELEKVLAPQSAIAPLLPHQKVRPN